MTFRILKFYVAFILAALDIHVVSPDSCPHHCQCSPSKHKATCSNLLSVPKLPSYVKTLVFRNNMFFNISSEFFSVLQTNDLESLEFYKNSIQFVNSDTFVNFTSLQQLYIHDENALDTDQVGRAIKRFNSENLMLLSLVNNNLQAFSFENIVHLTKLRLLDLSRNKIVSFKLQNIIFIRDLKLDGNDIVRLPNFCMNATTIKVPNLETLSLNGNAIRTLSSLDFKCLYSLQRLYLNGNRFGTLPNNVFTELHRLVRLSIDHNENLKTIAPFAFNSSSLKRLNFGYCRFQFKDHWKARFDAVNIFKHLPQLEFLDLTNNYLPTNNTILRQMFGSLSNLKELILQATALKALPTNAFVHLSLLKKLILSGNYINQWTVGAFDNMSNLRYLDMQGNDIHSLNKFSIPEEILGQLQNLSLGDNPFSCTCDIMWFRDWIRERNKSAVTLVNFPHRYKCRFPEVMRNTLLQQYNPTEESCRPWNPLFTMAIILSSFVVLVFVILFTAYNCHANIRNYFYLFNVQQRRRRGYLRLDSIDDFEYHAFIVYCDADREWVHKELLKRLEDDGLKICVHHRDFDPGTAITENIDTFMNKCWKIVVVMSNEFAESAWCQWEVDLIQERRRKCGKEALVLIMLRTINASHMTSGIKTLLGTTPYLVYKKGIGEDIFWTAAIDGLRRSLKFPPMAV